MSKTTTMWKVVYGEPSPRAVTAEKPWYPNADSDNETIFENTHFLSLDKAWEKHLAEHKAGMSLAALRAAEARKESVRRDKECADAAILYTAAVEAHAKWLRAKENSDAR